MKNLFSLTIRAWIFVMAMIGFSNVIAQEFWGTTTAGGNYGAGTVYKTDANGEHYEVVHHFHKTGVGDIYDLEPVLATNGKLYGVPSISGYGDAVYEINPSTGAYKIVYDANPPDVPTGQVFGRNMVALGDLLYGTYSSERSGIFSFDPDTYKLTSVVTFDDDLGESPIGLAILNGKLYVVNSSGAALNRGSIVEYDPTASSGQRVRKVLNLIGAAEDSVHYAFNLGMRAVAMDDKLYSIANQYPNSNLHAFYEFDPAEGTIEVVYKVPDQELFGSGTTVLSYQVPYQGKLYGVGKGNNGNPNWGVLYAFDPKTRELKVLHEFVNPLGGVNPVGLVEQGGVLYGTLQSGGIDGYGAVFSYDIERGGVPTVHHHFKKDDGNGGIPVGRPAMVGSKFYSGYQQGGKGETGGLFEWNLQTHQVTNVLSFYWAELGGLPNGRVAEYNGKIYGTTKEGGEYNRGVIFEVDAATGTYTKLYDFDKSHSQLHANHLLATDGKLYGTSPDGMYFYALDLQTKAFKLIAPNELNYAFPGNSLPFEGGLGRLVEWNGKIYGTTRSARGEYVDGFMFEMDPTRPLTDGAFAMVHLFSGEDGRNPIGDLLAYNGKLYGIAENSGNGSDGGVLFEYDLTKRIYTIQHVFRPDAAIGRRPNGTLTRTGDTLYGILSESPSGYPQLFAFDLTTGAVSGVPGLQEGQQYFDLAGLNGKLYGTDLGNTGNGGFFMLDPEAGTREAKVDFDTKEETAPTPNALLFTRLDQTIDFPQLDEVIFRPNREDIEPQAVASSGLPVLYSSSDTTVATVADGKIHIVGVGIAEIRAYQPGDEWYDSAIAMQQLVVKKAPQVITFEPLPASVTPGSDAITPVYSVDTGLPLTLESRADTVADIVNGKIEIHDIGKVEIIVSQAGNEYYEAAADTQLLIVRQLVLGSTEIAENNNVGVVVGELQVEGPEELAYTFELMDPDGEHFEIAGNELKAKRIFDFETLSAYVISVRATAGEYSYERAFTVEVTDVNEAPTALEIDLTNIDENNQIGAAIGVLRVTDADADEAFTYELLVDDAEPDDWKAFSIEGAELRAATVFDAERQNSYRFHVKVTDKGGLSLEMPMSVTINDLPEPPTAISLSSSSVSENNEKGEVIGSLSAEDPDAGSTFTFSLVTGEGATDNAAFRIEGTQLKAAETFDYESKSSYSVRIRVTDNDGLYFEQVFTIGIRDVAEGPESIRFTPQSVYENTEPGALVGTLSSEPASVGPFTYSLVAGEGDKDNALFSIDGGRLVTKAKLDYEQQSDYSVLVRSRATGGTLDKIISIALLDVNERPTLDAVADLVACSSEAGPHRIELTGITAGRDRNQRVSLTVSTTGADLFDNIDAVVKEGQTGELQFTLNGQSGEATVTITVKDDGGIAHGGVDAHSVSFQLTASGVGVSITADTLVIAKGETLVLTASGASTYNWAPAPGIQGAANGAVLTVRPSETTIYRVTGADETGCTATAEVAVEVVENYEVIQGTNILSPNGDGVNDNWVIENIDMYPKNKVTVFDLSGRIIYTKSGYANDWNGTFNGSPLKEGTYYYIIEFNDASAKAVKGFITILKDR